MWPNGTAPSFTHPRTFGARAFVHEERYTKKLTMKAWERRLVGYGTESKTSRISETDKTTFLSWNVTFIGSPPLEFRSWSTHAGPRITVKPRVFPGAQLDPG